MAMRAPLVLPNLDQASWGILQRRAAHEPDAHTAPAPAPTDDLIRAWRRSRALGAPTEGLHPDEAIVRGAELALRSETMAELWQIAPATLERTVQHPSLRDFVLLFADADGMVTRALGGGAFADTAKQLRLIEGAIWNEAARGTNAIGTSLAEDRPTAVVGAAHYGRAYRELICLAAPLHDATGRIIGVLDATSYATSAPTAGAIATALDTIANTAAAIEDVLRMRALSAAGSSVQRLVGRLLERLPDPVVLVDPRGGIVRSNEAARYELGVRANGESLSKYVQLSWQQIAAALASGHTRSLIVPSCAPAAVTSKLTAAGASAASTSHSNWRVLIEPVQAADGDLLGVVLVFEATGPQRPRTAQRDAGTARTTPSGAAAWSPGPHVTAPAQPNSFATIVAEDANSRAAVDLAQRVASSELPVMLLAETGTGKEVFANAIHSASPLRHGPFVALNCGALAPALLEAELFGHGPGAFTGSRHEGRTGLLHAAHGGTLFLDEIGEMPLAMQTALLRFLENGTFVRVGESHESRAEVRLICATCQDLPALVADGRFRNDLYFRLKGVVIRLPALRDRQDKLALAHALLARRGETRTLSQALCQWIEHYRWPGNIREMRTLLDGVRVLAGAAPVFDVCHLPPEANANFASASASGRAPNDGPADTSLTPLPPTNTALATAEANAITQALQEQQWNVSAAARRLGVARSTVYRMMERYGIHPPK